MGRDLAALEELEGLVGGLLRHVSPEGQRKILKAVAKDLRKGQADRIKDQKNPDGTPYAPRKPGHGTKIRHRETQKQKQARLAMFRRLRTSRFLKVGITDRELWIGFLGRIANLARVHQEGLEDRPAKGMPKVRYPKRELLGFTDADREQMLDTVLKHMDAPSK